MVLFDTLKASLRLRDAGFDEEKAGAIVSAFAEDIGERLATKVNLQQLEARLAEQFARIEESFVRVEEQFARLEERMTQGEKSLEQRLTIRMGMMFTTAIGVLLAAIGIATGVAVSM